MCINFPHRFDSIDHCLLLLKLLSCGIDGNKLNWFKNYFGNRKQGVGILEYTQTGLM